MLKTLVSKIKGAWRLRSHRNELLLKVNELLAKVAELSAECERLSYLALGTEMGDGPPVVVVNSLPKTGSQTIIHSLRAAGKMRVHHHHALSDEGIKALLADTSSSTAPADIWSRLEKLKQTLNIRQDIVNELARPDSRRAYFICGLREPVGLFLSHVFQLRLERQDVHKVGDGPLNLDRLVEMLGHWYSGQSGALVQYLPEPETWMRREIVSFLGIDPFQIGFDAKAGFTKYSGRLGPLLLYRVEDLNTIFDTALQNLLGPLGHGIKRTDVNLAAAKSYSSDYDHVVQNLVVPDVLLDKIYNGTYAQTFYTQDEINMFKSGWRLSSVGNR
jgi:hypothetical protein